MSIFKWLLAALGVLILVAVGLYSYARASVPPLDEEGRRAASGEFVKLSKGQVHFDWHGPVGGPVVVLVHGFSTPSFVWGGLLPKLTGAGLRVLTYDHYGRGFSDRPDLDYNATLFEEQLLELLASQGLQAPVALVGYSMGGAVATHFTAHHPSRVNQLALIAPAGFPIGDGGAPGLLSTPVIGDWLMQVFGRQLLLARLSSSDNQVSALPDFRERSEEQLQYDGYLRALLSTIRHFPMGGMELEFATVGRSDIPVFSIWGRLDQTIPIANAERVKAAIPQAEVEIIDRGTHAITYSEADRVANALVNFLASQSPRNGYSGSQ